MNGYVTKKENLRVFKANREEQRGKSFVRGRSYKESGKASCDVLSSVLREFRGEIVSNDKMILFPFENL